MGALSFGKYMSRWPSASQMRMRKREHPPICRVLQTGFAVDKTASTRKPVRRPLSTQRGQSGASSLTVKTASQMR